MSKIQPTEFGINMSLEKMLILQQAELKYVDELGYFDENDPCHLYFICKKCFLSTWVNFFLWRVGISFAVV